MRPVSLTLMGLAGALLLAPAALAQSNSQSNTQSNSPAASQSPAAKSAAAPDEGAGSTIVGNRESPIGLYLTPWKNEYAERGMDRPAQIVQEQMAPVDPDVFRRQNSYYDTITRFRQAELGGSK